MRRPLSKRRISLSLRTKLLLVSLALLVIPWTGYRYVRSMEAYLRHGQEDAVLATARAVATVIHEHRDLFRYHGGVVRSAREGSHLYVRPLDRPIQLDGYAEDWAAYRDRRRVSALLELR